MTVEAAVQVTVLCVVSALLALILKRSTPEWALLLAVATIGAAALFLTEALGETAELLRELTEGSGVDPALFLPLYKTVGIALVVKVGASLCRDAGESALAAAVETAGAVCALLVSLPLLRAVLSMLLELMG